MNTFTGYTVLVANPMRTSRWKVHSSITSSRQFTPEQFRDYIATHKLGASRNKFRPSYQRTISRRK